MTTQTQRYSTLSAVWAAVLLLVTGFVTSCGTATVQGPVAGFVAPKYGMTQSVLNRNGVKVDQESQETASKINVEELRAKSRQRFYSFCNIKKQQTLLTETAAGGKAVAQRQLADCLMSDNKVAEAIGWYEMAARQGSVKAHYALALLYETGMTVDSFELIQQDADKAFELYSEAAELGYPPAQYNLAVLLSRGAMGEPDNGEAALWYEKAAVSGVADAAYNLATLYVDGDGIERDDELAFKWYKVAALAGNPHGMHRLAYSYDLGRGVKTDAEEAYKWYLKAAIRDNADAQFSLAAMYIKGCGIEKSDKEAKRWLLKAARLGHPKSLAFLCTLEGHGAESDCDTDNYLAATTQ